jgi:hypothetical protein
MTVVTVADMRRVAAIGGTVTLRALVPGTSRKVGAITLYRCGGSAAISIMDVRDGRLDREEDEAEGDETGRQAVPQ